MADPAAELVTTIRQALRDAAQPERAPAQQAYMKSAMPFLGVSVPVVRRIARSAAKASDVRDGDDLRDAARMLWDDAAHREERYAAMALLAVGDASADHAVVPLVEHMVRTGRWWDYTDELAHRLASLHDSDPFPTAALAREWSVDEDRWIRRIAIISQLGRRDRLDPDLLAAVIEPNRGDGEFFIRKAIGWALREYARVDPEWVRDYVDHHPLSPLSRREALKRL
jgi:3-methyladenine DNA glycosylase AlkD